MNRTFKLLIIDDNKEILDALCEFLRKKKYDIISANNGLEGLKYLVHEAAWKIDRGSTISKKYSKLPTGLWLPVEILG